jgi:hypothetical protein
MEKINPLQQNYWLQWPISSYWVIICDEIGLILLSSFCVYPSAQMLRPWWNKDKHVCFSSYVRKSMILFLIGWLWSVISPVWGFSLTIAYEGWINLGLCSVIMGFEKEWIFIVPRLFCIYGLIWRTAHLVATYKQGVLRTYFYPGSQLEVLCWRVVL